MGACHRSNHILPFLWIHGEDEETYRKMVRVIHDANIGAFCIEARPHPDFCGEGWWRDLAILLDEAARWNMKVWILDDRHFPTGYAGGAVKDAPLSLRRRHITHRSIPVTEGHPVDLEIREMIRPREELDEIGEYMLRISNDGEIPVPVDRDELLICAAYGPDRAYDLTGEIRNGRLIWIVPEGITSLEFCGLTYDSGFHRSYINMMDEASCRIQIDAVYEPHYEHFGDLFGTVIAGFFSDEPELGNGNFTKHYNLLGTDQTLPYSDALVERLEAKLGRYWRIRMPLLWRNDGDPAITAQVRYCYMDSVSRLVQECFSEQIGDWCRAHGVQYIGHVIEDNNQHARTSTSLAHYFRCQRGQDMSGIDDIGGQVMPGGEDRRDRNIFGSVNDGEFYHYALGKLGSSAAAITPPMQGRAMCELFGNYGWQEGVRLEKYLVDHFLVRGINWFVPHAFNCAPYPDPDCPPHFYAQGNHPQYRHFGQLMAYTNRLAEILSEGRAVMPAAILYHGEGEWCGDVMLMQKPARVLMDRQIDFCFLPSDVFPESEYYRTEIGQEFSVNGNIFELLIVPYMQFIPREAAWAIAEMPRKVIFLDDLPQGTCTGERLPDRIRACRVVPLGELGEFAEVYGGGRLRDVAVIPENNRIRVRHMIGERERIFLINEGQSTWRGTVLLPDSRTYEIYDACEDRTYAARQSGRRVFAELAPSESLLLVERTETGAEQTEEPEAAHPMSKQALRRFCGEAERRELTHFTVSTCRAVSYPDFQNAHEVNIPVSYAETDPGFSGVIRYETALGPEVTGPAVLEITEAWEGVEVFVNGVSLGLRILSPCLYDLSGFLTDGTDIVAIEVATTPERELAPNPGAAPTGLTGPVYLYSG